MTYKMIYNYTISLQKKVLGTDRLKRLDSSTSLFQRQTSLISKKMTNLANKFVNPFSIIKKKIEPSTVDSQIDLRTNMKRQVSLVENKNDITIIPKRTVMISPLKRTRDDDNDDDEPQERRKVEVLSVNNEIRRPTGLFSYEEEEEEEEPKRHVVPVQTLSSKRFKLGATTSFLTRSLANHGLIE
ncbi:unnamed protein product [Rotaria sp. Silwood1]|nr:unnamed protein product [Rotaria sp. Silwood1]